MQVKVIERIYSSIDKIYLYLPIFIFSFADGVYIRFF